MPEYINRPYLFPRNVGYYFLRILLIQTYRIQDCKFYDDGTSDKSNSYSAKKLGVNLITNSISYSNSTYTVTSGVNSSAWTGVSPPISLSTTDNWIVRIKVKGNLFSGLTLGDNIDKHLAMIRYLNDHNWGVYGYVQPNNWVIPRRSLTTSNTYYIQEVKLENGTLTYSIYNTNETLLDSASVSLPSAYENITLYPCAATYPNDSSNNKVYFQEFMVKSL